MIGSLNEYAHIEVTKAIDKWRTTFLFAGNYIPQAIKLHGGSVFSG